MTLAASVFTDELTMDFADAVQTAAAAGLRYVDIRRLWDVYSHELPRHRWSDMRAILDAHDMRVGAIQSNFGKCPLEGPGYDEHRAFFPTLIEQAHYFGTKVIRCFPFWQSDRTSTEPIRANLEPNLSTIVRQLRPAAALAEREGVVLALEPERSTFGGSASEVRRILDAVESPALKVAWDVDNAWTWEPIFPDGYEQVRGLVVNVHVKDRASAPDRIQGGDPGQRALLGSGALPWPDVIRTLRADGYEGIYSIETHFGRRGAYGWPKLNAASAWYMYALRELLEAAD